MRKRRYGVENGTMKMKRGGDEDEVMRERYEEGEREGVIYSLSRLLFLRLECGIRWG